MPGRCSRPSLRSSAAIVPGWSTTIGLRIAAITMTVGVGLTMAGCPRPSGPPPTSDGSPLDDGAEPPPVQPPAAEERKLAVPSDHPLFARFEGEGFANDCQTDAACHIGGCSSEVCSADEGVITTCDVPPVAMPEGTACGCVAKQCRWWNAAGQTLPLPPAPAAVDCDGKPCAAPAECIEYFGIAGPRGPKFYSCEIRCTPSKPGCPDGTACVTVVDGPGSVCR